MVAARDKQLLDLLKESNAFVCFRDGEDVFEVVAFSEPTTIEYVKDPKIRGFARAWGDVTYARFSKGLNEDFRLFLGDWKRRVSATTGELSPEGSPGFISDRSDPDTQGIIDESEISLSYTFQNLSKTKTTFYMQIRRSTLRFNESWTYPDKDNKTDNRTENTGHCKTFN